jgi:hypothetical protein
MSAPYRIRRPEVVLVANAGGEENLKQYLDRLMKLIPGEAMGLYLVGSGLIPSSDKNVLALWALVCLVAVIVVRVFGTADLREGLTVDWVHVVLSSIAFIIWVYTSGGPFEAFGLHVPYVGSLLVLAFTFFVPIFYKGSIA